MTRITKETAKQLDAELAQMTDKERNELIREGRRLMQPDKTAKAAYMKDYMPKYHARRALAARQGLVQPADPADGRGKSHANKRI